MKRRLLAFLLAFVMTFSLVPVNAFATGAPVSLAAAEQEEPVEVQAEGEELISNIGFVRAEDSTEKVSMDVDYFAATWTFTLNSDFTDKSLWATFRYNPTTTEFFYIVDPGLNVEDDTENGILRIGGDNGSIYAADFTFEIAFRPKAIGDATVTLESFRIDDEDYLSESIAVATTVCYSVSWDEYAACTVTGEKLAVAGEDYTFTVAAKEGYDAADMVVKVNGEVVTPVDGKYTVENVDSDLAITVEAEKTEPAYTVDFRDNTSGGRLGLEENFKTKFFITSDRDVSFKTFVAKFHYDPAAVTYAMAWPNAFGAKTDDKTGTLTLTAGNGNYTANKETTFEVFFESCALGDTTITLTSAVVDGKEVLSEPIAVTRTVGYKVNWTDDDAYTVTGEKYVDVKGTYTFTVAASDGYDASNAVVKVNGTEVTAVDGKYTVAKVTSDLTITVEGVTEAVKQPGLSDLSFGDANRKEAATMLETTAPFDPAVKEYTVLVPDCFVNFYVWATKADGRSDNTVIMATFTNLNVNKERKKVIVSGAVKTVDLVGMTPEGKATNTAVITITDGDYKDEYKVNTIRVPSLSALSLDGVSFNENFHVMRIAYTATTDKASVTVAATPLDGVSTVTYNGSTNPTVPLTVGENEIKVVATDKDGRFYTYTITVTRSALEANFSVTPADAKVTVWDSKNTKLESKDGKYAVEPDETYTYLVQKDGYVSQKNTFTLKESSTIDITLTEATENPNLDRGMTAEWGNFRKGDDNLGITNAKTPYDPEEAELLWAKTIGGGYPGSPIIVDGDIFTYSASNIYRVDSMTGETVARGTMVGQSSFSITPMTYADGMVFVGLSGGRIQAFNAKTLESLWVYTDELGGQPNCPITYKDGYIYAGFWNGEDRDGNFACIDTIDEDHASTTEAKYASWTYTRQGGFYWAGAYVTDKLAIVGTDDGASGYNTNGAALLVFDRYTGEKLDAHEGIRGDLRSNVSHDPESDRVFFTTKGGILGNAQIDWDTGKILDYKEVVIKNSKGTANAMSTCTPSVYNGRIYIGVSGDSQFGKNSGHGIAVYDLNGDGSMTQAYVYDIIGYPQTSAMVSTAYSAEDGYVYIYLPYNYTPGGVSVLKDKPGQTAPLTTTGSGSGYSEVFTPVGTLAQYCICSTIADQYGTIYYKNDSCYVMAITSKIESLEITQYPTITENEDGSITVDGLKAVTKLKNGLERDVSNYVSVVKNEETGGYTVSYTYGFDNDSYGLKTVTAEIVDYTVTIPEDAAYTITGEKTVKGGEDYTFTVTVTEGYDATNMVVKVNGEEVKPVDGKYTVEKVSANLEIAVEGVTKKVTYTVNFEGMSGAGDSVALGAAFEGVFSVTADSDVSYETFVAAFKFDPAVVSVTYVRPAIFEQNIDTENGILTLTSKNSSFPANRKGEIMIGFKSIAFGDATVSLTSVKANDSEVLSEPIALAKAAGYKVDWTEDDTYTITGEKYADVNGTYTFTVAANKGYDASNAVVKVNGETVTAVDGKYTVEKVTSDLTITVEGVTEKTAVWTAGFDIPEDEKTNIAIGGEDDWFNDRVTFGTDKDTKFESVEILIRFNPETTQLHHVMPQGLTQELDNEAGTLKLSIGESGSGESNDMILRECTYYLAFTPKALGDATVIMEYFKVDGEDILSAPVALARTVGYKVTWAEDDSYTVTGEKYAAVDGTYTFTVAAKDGYDASKALVKVNGTEVTAVDGVYTVEKVTSDLTITVEGVTKAATHGISDMRFGTAATVGAAKYYEMSPSFDPAVKEYTLLVPDSASAIYLWAARSADRSVDTDIYANWTSLIDNSKKSERILNTGMGDGKSLDGFAVVGETVNTLTITVTDGDFTDEYTVKLVRTDPTLENLSLDGIKINETFASDNKAYTAKTTKDSVTILATPRGKSYTVTYNGKTDRTIPLNAGENKVDIVVTNKNGYSNTYTLTVTKADHSVTIPEDESCHITGEEAVADGADYTFKVEIDYRYEADKDFAVKVNGETVTGKDGVYTVKNVKTDLVITVEGVKLKVLEPVTVYFSFSHDEQYKFCGASGEVVALKKVTVPYFDLGLYGLEKFYFSSEDYGPADPSNPKGGSALDPGTKEYAYGKITMLHLFIYATEVYYQGIDPADAGKGYLKNHGLNTSDVFRISGSAGSFFIPNLWDYDLNLNYYLNNEYPLGSEGWGSTADQILIHDGDVATIGHFTDWGFFSDSGAVFNHIETDITDPVQGDKVKMTIYLDGADGSGNYTTGHTLRTNCPDVYCTLADDVTTGDVTKWTKVGTAAADGTLVVDTSTLAPGEYIFAIPGQYGNENPNSIVSAPGGIRLTIHEKTAVKGDINGDGIINVADAMALYTAIGKGGELDAAVADINGDGIINMADVMALYTFVQNGNK